jgi:EmrB/QacA subfamily drug resistance transporter
MTSSASAIAQTPADRRRWIALAVVVTAQFMVILDVAVVNVALPSIKSDLHFSEQGLQWVITAYAIVFGGVLLLGGRLGDVLGRRRIFVAGLAVFAVSSLLCGLAWSETSLIGFRALQGLGGAMLAPATLSILMTTFPEGPERNTALGIWGAASGSGGAAGVLLGGVLTSYLSWSWIFFVNVPVAAVVIALAPVYLRESRIETAHRRFDFAGAASVTAGLMLLVYALTRATQDGWGSTSTIALLSASACLIATFLAIEVRSRAPLLPLRLFRVRTVAAANAAGVIVAAGTFSLFFLLTLYMQQVLGYTAIQTGIAYLTITLAVVVFSNVAQRLVTRVGAGRVMTAGLLVSAGALGLFARLPVHGHYFWDVFPALLLGGVGIACSFVPMAIASLAGVEARDAGVASGLLNTSRQIGGAVGLAVVSTIATTYTSHYVAGHPGTSSLNGSALTHGFDIAFSVLAALAVIGAVIAALFVESRPRKPQVVELPEPQTMPEAA